jgi:hypothetical protein
MLILICAIVLICAGCSNSPKRDLKDLKIINISPETQRSYAIIYLKDKDNNVLEYKLKIIDNNDLSLNDLSLNDTNNIELGRQISDKIKELLEKEYKEDK